MKKFFLGIFIGTIIALGVVWGFRFLEENYPDGYNVNWIVGSTYDEIVEKYGEFDETISYSDYIYPYSCCLYLTKEANSGFLSIPFDKYFAIYFDSDGIAYDFEKDYINP